MIVSSESQLAQFIPEPITDMFEQLFGEFMGRENEPVESLTITFSIGEVRHALEDARKFYLKLETIERNAKISAGASVLSFNLIAIGATALTVSNSVRAIKEEFDFRPDTLRWKVATLYALGWRFSSSSENGIILKKTEATKDLNDLGRSPDLC